MRITFFIFLTVALSGLALHGQAPEKRFVGNCSFSGFALLADSLYRGDIVNFSDRMGNGYNLTQLVVGYEIFDGRGLVFEIDTIHASTNLSADVSVTAKIDRGFAPFGSGQVYNPTANGLIPPSSQEQAGLSPTQKARIDIHNVVAMQSLIGGRDSVYIITNVPDTSSLSPVVGDAFINTAADTLGLYDGVQWQLFYGGDGNGIYEAANDGSLAQVAHVDIPGTFAIATEPYDSIGGTGPLAGYYYGSGDDLLRITNERNARDLVGELQLTNGYGAGGQATLRGKTGDLDGTVIVDGAQIEVRVDSASNASYSLIGINDDAITMAGKDGGPIWSYQFPREAPSVALGDTTIMAWRGDGATGQPIGFVPIFSGADYPDRVELADSTAAVRDDLPSIIDANSVNGVGVQDYIPYWVNSDSLGATSWEYTSSGRLTNGASSAEGTVAVSIGGTFQQGLSLNRSDCGSCWLRLYYTSASAFVHARYGDLTVKAEDSSNNAKLSFSTQRGGTEFTGVQHNFKVYKSTAVANNEAFSYVHSGESFRLGQGVNLAVNRVDTDPSYPVDIFSFGGQPASLRLAPGSAPVNAEGVLYQYTTDSRVHHMNGTDDNALAYLSDIPTRAYGSLKETGTTALSGTATFTKITGLESGLSENVTLTDSTITVTDAGDYRITYNFPVQVDAGAGTWAVVFRVYQQGGSIGQGRGAFQVVTSPPEIWEGTLSGNLLVTASASDVFDLRYTATSGATYTLNPGAFTIEKL